ncbi:MAG: hypothetical protein ACLFWB_08750 [Armatimonadota bacterium]
MRKVWPVVVILTLIVCALPAIAQDEAQAEAPLATIEQFSDATAKMMRQEDTSFDFQNAVLVPQDRETQVRIQSAMLLLQMTLAVSPVPDQAKEMTEDMAVVEMRPETIPFVMRNVQGEWKIDLEATVDRLPDRVRSVVEPSDEMMEAEMERGATNACYNNLNQLGIAALMYAKDNDGVLPDADEWMEQVAKYLEDESVLKCPAADEDYAYAMNENLDGMNVNEIESPATTVLFFESTQDARNASGTGASVPSPPRHSVGNGFAFANGRAKFQEETPNFDPTVEAPAQEGNQQVPPPTRAE